MTPGFFKAAENTLGFEGGYSLDPLDPGGETYKGIARQFNPTWPGWQIIDAAKLLDNFPKNLTTNKDLNTKVLEFYYEKFWLPLRCEELSTPIAMELFDNAFNQGPKIAIECLQWSVLFFGQKLTVDGNIGPLTIKAVNLTDQPSLLKAMNWFQATTYIVGSANVEAVINFMRPFFLDRKDHVRRYIKGWLKRVTF